MNNRVFTYKSLPNILSVLRMALVFPFVLIVRDIIEYQCPRNLALIILFVLILGSDVADGYLARRFKCATGAGAKLDVASDAVYTLLSLGTFAYFKIIPIWFIVVMALKLIEFAVTSRVLRGRRAGAPPVFDKMGKLSVCLVMLLPGVFVFRCVITDYKLIMNILIYAISALLLASHISRLRHLARGQSA
ncbi:MAG: CDP-alcohol phosphatidyltransferase family protein [Spirochaetaceae bacterium]|nr:CDP-alcohol phosphatidyltransferase family protein [Spirochaetaceae bacterium]